MDEMVIRVSRKLHRRIKAAAALRGLTLGIYIERVMLGELPPLPPTDEVSGDTEE